MAKKFKTGFEQNEEGFGNRAKLHVQIEMKKRDLGYRELTELLNSKFGQDENERNVRNKVARGTFSAGFFLLCLVAMGVPSISLSDYDLFGTAMDLDSPARGNVVK